MLNKDWSHSHVNFYAIRRYLYPNLALAMTVPEKYYNNDENSFAYTTVRSRWPLIIARAIEDVKSATLPEPDPIVHKLGQLIANFTADAPLIPFTDDQVALFPACNHYNRVIDAEGARWKWLSAPWLFSECYLYVCIHLCFLEHPNVQWHTFDVFAALKDSTFLQLLHGVAELCARYHALSSDLSVNTDKHLLRTLFSEFIDISLWGNATDLSLLAGSVSVADIQSVQGAQVRKQNESRILANDTEQAWSHLTSDPESTRVDIVLDNSGFELLTDIVLALFLLDSGLGSSVHFHCKQISWFVSDTMEKDVAKLLDQLLDREFYKEAHSTPASSQGLSLVAQHARRYISSRQIIIESHPFWTLADNFWLLGSQPLLRSELRQSALVIFKGDLNYRKLTGDLQWAKTTPFTTSIQHLASSAIPVLSLRTCKADVVVGLDAGTDERIAKEYAAMGNANGRFWSSSGKWAVISFSSGNAE